MDIRDFELYTSFCVGKETFFVGVSTSKTTSQPLRGELRRQAVFVKDV